MAHSYYSSQNEARNATQILAVVAVSFGAYIYGTTVVFPAVANPSLRESNTTFWSSNFSLSSSTTHSNKSLELSKNNNCSSCSHYHCNSNCNWEWTTWSCDTVEYCASYQSNSTDAYLPFVITENDLSLVGEHRKDKKEI